MSKRKVDITISKTAGSKRSIRAYDRQLSIVFPAGAHSLDIVVAPLHQICDAFIDLELALSERPASCKAGCAVCCNQLIPLSGIEVLYLQKVVAKMPRSTRRRVYAACESRRNRAEHMIQTAAHKPSGFGQRYFELGMACPFIHKGECRIHPKRPLTCREYNVDSPPHLCESPYTSSSLNRIAKGLNLGAMLGAFSSRMLKVDNRPVPMFLFEHWGEENPFIRLTYDSQMLMESLLNAIKTTVDNSAVFSSFTWRYTNCVSTKADKVNGTKVLEPKKLPKLLVRHANALNVQKTLQIIEKETNVTDSREPIIEIGAGRGYFRYIAGFVDDDQVHDFAMRIIETENDERIVSSNLKLGKCTLRVDAAGLVEEFGKNYASAVLSMNVLDVFSRRSLSVVLDNILEVLLPGGIVVHMMSSAIHESVFQEIAAEYGQQILLPYISGNYLGVLSTRPSNLLIKRFPQFCRGHISLAQLCATSMEQYIQMAQEVSATLGQCGHTYSRILFHEYSLEKISACLQQKGFEVLYKGLISSTKTVRRNKFHKKVGKANAIVNKMGALTINQESGISVGMVKESSTFGLVIGRTSRGH